MDTATYAPSRYAILMPLDNGRALAYNGFNGSLALWDAEELNAFRRLEQGEKTDRASGALERLVSGGFAVPEEMDELAALEEQYRLHRYDHDNMTLTIAPTLRCNFACDYCYQGKEKRGKVMTGKVQDALVGLVELAAGSMKRLHVAWYGGEPLLEKEIIASLSERFMEICERRKIRYDAMIVTNGYLLNSAAAEMLGRCAVRTVQVTFDGPAAFHDARRVLHSGRPTFARILSNIEKSLGKAPLRFSTRVNIDARNIHAIPELIDLLAERGLGNHRDFGLYFAPVEATTDRCHDVAGVCIGKSSYGQEEAALLRHAAEKGLTGRGYPPRFRGSCAATRPRGFVVLPGGQLHKCWHTVHDDSKEVGTVFAPESVRSNAVYRSWLDWSPFAETECRQCRLLPVCAGACGHKFLYPDQAMGEGGKLPCISWRYNIEERLQLWAEKSDAMGPDLEGDAAEGARP